MSSDLGAPILEASPAEFHRSSMRRSHVRLKWGTLAAATAGLMLLVYFILNNRGPPNVIAGYAIGISALLAVSLYYSAQVSRMNRFGVFERGIAPTRNTKRHRSGDRLILPTDSISEIEYKSIGAGEYPKSHFAIKVRTKDGEEFEFDATEIEDQFLGDRRKTEEARLLLRESAKKVQRGLGGVR